MHTEMPPKDILMCKSLRSICTQKSDINQSDLERWEIQNGVSVAEQEVKAGDDHHFSTVPVLSVAMLIR